MEAGILSEGTDGPDHDQGFARSLRARAESGRTAREAGRAHQRHAGDRPGKTRAQRSIRGLGRLPRGKKGHRRRGRELELPSGRGACGARGGDLPLPPGRTAGSGHNRETGCTAFCAKRGGRNRTRSNVTLMRVFVGVGSNVEPNANVKSALLTLDRAVGVRALSTFYRTPALDRPSDPPFVNGVIEVRNALGPLQLKQLLRRTEQDLRRRRGSDRYAPRSTDLDLLVYGGLVCNSDELRLPDPAILERPFVAIPLLEVAPDLIVPGSDATLRSVVTSISPYPMKQLPDLTRELRKELSNES